MSRINATITGVGGYLPEYILTNDEISKMVDTSDEWIMTRIGIKERRILKEKEKATSDLGVFAIQELLQKTNTNPEEIELVICATITPDMQFPSTANLISHNLGMINAFGYDISAACSGFIYGLDLAAKYIETGKHKKVIVVGAEKMSSIIDYQDRATCPIFGDGAAAVLLEPSSENFGIIDSILRSDGAGKDFLHLKSGGSLNPTSHETIDANEHFVFQDGQPVFKAAVSKMADVSVEMMEKHNIDPNDLTWFVPHQANMRIINATARRMGIKKEKVMINIEKYGNTTAATIPLCLWDYEKQLKKGDKVILAAFGGGFTWGSIYLKWSYNS